MDLDLSKISNSEAKNLFFQTLALPIQSVCRSVVTVRVQMRVTTDLFRTLKRVGGHWHVGGPGQHKQVDGDKFVCLDSLLGGGECLVYSFGLAADWTFEDQMDKLGCSIFAYDHTISALAHRGNNIKYFKTGLGIGPNLKTLKQILEENNQLNSNIDYLKVWIIFLQGRL